MMFAAVLGLSGLAGVGAGALSPKAAAAAPTGARKPLRPGGGKAAVTPPTATERKPEEERRGARPEDERELKRGDRVEFDGRIIEGQTAAQGAIYLFERLPSELRSMVLERRSYRAEVLETLYPNAAPPAPAPGTAERPPGSAERTAGTAADRPGR